MYGVEIWGIYEALKQSVWQFCVRILGVHRCAANGTSELELGSDSSTGGKTVTRTVK
jgi:hypothetical protein